MKRTQKGRGLTDFAEQYTVVDIETSGLNPSSDKIIEIGALKVIGSQVIDTYSTLIDPEISISNYITELTGIRNSDLQSAPKTAEALADFYRFAGNSILVGHNVNFDINFLYDDCLTHLNQYLTNDYIDTLRLSQKYVKESPNHKLTTLSAFLHIDTPTQHRALADCYTTHFLYRILQKKANPIQAEQTMLFPL